VPVDLACLSKFIAVFLRALEDYRSDRRGDVGSWCRLQGIQGINKLVLDSSRCDWAGESFRNTMDKSIVGALLKQLSEKLGTIRQAAGNTLVSILQAPILLTSDERDSLLQALQVTSSIAVPVNWNNPAVAFPIVMKVASFDCRVYFESIIAGIVSSIGDLTEDVKKNASNSFVRWAKDGEEERRLDLGLHLLDLLESNAEAGRLFVSILKTINLLFSHGCFTAVMRSNRDFALRCQTSLDRELHATDVARAYAVLDCCLSLLLSASPQDSVYRRALGFLCKMLEHTYPCVRSYAAQHFYLYLMERNDGNDEVILDLVLRTPWKSESLDDYQRFPSVVAEKLDVQYEFTALKVE
jgi:tubulin-specific chaperone D